MLTHLLRSRKDPKQTSPRRRRERGGILVEMTMTLFPLTLIAMGMVEIGLAWRDSSVLEQASRSGARVSANLANDAASDREALRGLVAQLKPRDLDQIEYVVFYEVDASGNMPAGCEDPTSVTANCNYFPVSALTQTNLNDDSKWECANSSAYDDNWCPTSRNPEFHSPVDLGVKIKAKRPWMTGFFPGDGLDLKGETIMRLNPLTR